MPDDYEDIINTPIDADDFKSDDNESTDDIDIEDDDIDPVGDIGLDDSEFDSELNDEMSDLPNDELNDDSGLGVDSEINVKEMTPPEEQIRWTAIPQENGDIWSEHINGFILRARPLSSQQDSKIKYSVQLFKDNKMVDNGVTWIDQSVDPREYLQNLSDRILDRMNLINLSKMEPEKDFGGNGDEEMDLGDEEMDLGDEEEEISLDDLES